MVQEQKLEREVERARRMEEERGEMEKELREKETEMTSSACSLQAKEHHVRLAEEQVHTHFWQETFCFSCTTNSLCTQNNAKKTDYQFMSSRIFLVKSMRTRF